MVKFSTTVAQVVTTGLLMAFAGSASAQQAYPNKPIRFVVPYTPGGSTSVLARIVAQKLAETLGQPVIVDNRPGASTIIGAEVVAKAAPDGYTILVTTNTHVLVPLLLPTPYDAIKDFAPVATLAISENILVIHPSVPANNLRELIALAKSRPGQLNYASTGSGSAGHLTGELFNIMTGVRTLHIPYKGAGPVMTDLIGGQIQMYTVVPINVLPYIKSGRLRPIAITGESRMSALPEVPTFTEAGLPGFEVKTWLGVFAPAGTLKAIIDKLSTEVSSILGTPDFREKLSAQGMAPFVSTPEQFAAVNKAYMAQYAKVIKIANIKLE